LGAPRDITYFYDGRVKRVAVACLALSQSAEGLGITVRQMDPPISTVRATRSRFIRPEKLVGSPDYVIYVVDDDVRICEALAELFTSLDVQASTFGTVAEYLAFQKPDLPGCLILDVELPDINGLDFQRQLRDGDHPPIVFITGHGNIPSSVRAMKDGAVDFLVKPFGQQQLMAAVDAAIARDRLARVDRSERARLQDRYASLTPRESEVLPLVVSGLLNKQAAAELGISEVTLQLHRSRIMQKMAADSFADLVRMAGRLNIALRRRKQQ
jgi:FixJ family two-component response regulator